VGLAVVGSWVGKNVGILGWRVPAGSTVGWGSVGSSVGKFVDRVGISVGNSDVKRVGNRVDFDGFAVGRAEDGLALGGVVAPLTVGANDGFKVEGLTVEGVTVGANDGVIEGVTVGANDGFTVEGITVEGVTVGKFVAFKTVGAMEGIFVIFVGGDGGGLVSFGVVGSTEGTHEGNSVGNTVGSLVALTSVGATEGTCEGIGDGISVGCNVGKFVSPILEGSTVGVSEGFSLGPTVGADDGPWVG
jgi:hypothetical protein